MALRLRKDVQKASYYVWFLGAEEARGLRGSRVLLSAIPNLIERSRDMEPLKVTLQVSGKGMKIVQGASKHFITHSAITCSMQTDDIVACVLLLYNPTTKCPLHVHAYRCDSETTAQALHQFLQVLIMRPENQKRFAELEARLGLQSMHIGSPPPASSASGHRSLSSPDAALLMPKALAGDGKHAPVRRFESSLGSDTGTSTRESECSDELTLAGSAPKSSSLYDSLAAELRAKLNGNGPPLLLPPRDYDTVHRSKGNLAATELRRCRNSLIVGDKISKPPTTPLVPSSSALTGSRSRGSSGIGSDLAPSPTERPIEHSSSDDEDWMPNAHMETPVSAYPVSKTAYAFDEHYDRHQPAAASDASPPSYLYPSARDESHSGQLPIGLARQATASYVVEPQPVVDKRRSVRSSSREKSTATQSAGRSAPDEQDIRPIIIRPRTYDSRFKHVLDERKGTAVQHVDADDDDDDLALRRDRMLAGKSGKAPLERRYRTADKVVLGKVPSYGQQRYDETDAAPIASQSLASGNNAPVHNYRFGERERNGKAVGDRELFDYRENLTDREKYRESQKYNQQRMYTKGEAPFDGHHNGHEYPLNDPHAMRVRKSYAEPSGKFDAEPALAYRRHQSPPEPAEPVQLSRSFKDKHSRAESSAYGGGMPRNPYKEPDSLPYRESIDAMIKSPVMRYKSFDGTVLGVSGSNGERTRDAYPSAYPMRSARSGSPDTVCRVSPKDRFNNAKEKFEQMERERNYAPVLEMNRYPSAVAGPSTAAARQRSPSPHRHGRAGGPAERYATGAARAFDLHHHGGKAPLPDWSSEEEPASGSSGHQHHSHHSHHQPLSYAAAQHHHQSPTPAHLQSSSAGRRGKLPTTGQSGGAYRDRSVGDPAAPSAFGAAVPLGQAKSLSNLARGYRHSYAEPRHAAPALPRNSGRVGLAAVNPF